MVAGCIALLEGRSVDAELIYALGGPPAAWVFTGTEPGPDYWLRVWALRGLLWTWDDSATSCLLTALRDDAWRAREMALKVVARHRVNAALASAASLQDDPSARVVAAANRALIRLA